MIDEITIHSDEDKPIRMAYSVTSARIQHYADVTEYMTRAAITRYIQKHKSQPSKDQLSVYQKELTRLMVVNKDILAAQRIDIS